MAIGIFLTTLIGVMAVGLPIAFALLISGIALMLFLDVFDTQIIAQNLISGANNFSLMAVPFFILAGEFMNIGGISQRIINVASALVGHIRGGLGFVAIIASVLFAGLSGSAVADTAALGAILIPMMVKNGYHRNRSVGLIASGGILAAVIPPSIPMIIFGVISGVSITKLFLAGLFPGILIATSLAIAWWFVVRKENYNVIPRKSRKEVFKSIKESIWALFLPIIIICGLRFGIFTPTEASVVVAFYAFIVGFVIYKEIKLKDIYPALVATAKTTSVVMFLAAAAMVPAWLIAIANIPAILADFLGPFVEKPLILMLLITLFVILIGMAMDLTPIILILTPILMPLVELAGIDPIYFGVVFLLTAVIGLLTPPVGTLLNVASGVGKISIENLLKGIWPFILAELIVLILLILFPALVLTPLEWLTQ